MESKSGLIWNSAGSIVYSFFNAIILIFCTRFNGTEIAGIFSITYATGCILNSIGDFGIRIFQVTDIKRKYNYEDYLFSRMVVVLIMLLCSGLFIIISGYTNEKLFICCILIAIRVVDNFSETSQAEFQLQGRLDISGKVLLIRNLLEIIIFAIADYFTHNIYISFSAMLISSIIAVFVLDNRIIHKKYKIKVINFNIENIKKIIKECLPLAISTLVSMYVINAVKYAIDKSGDYTMQTYFNILYMPTFVINLISILIVKSFLKSFGDYWNNKEYKKFIKIIAGIIIFLAISTIIVDIAAITIGIPVLGWMYHVDLSNYRTELFILIISGLFYASSTVIFYALGTIRKQGKSTIAYGITSVFALIISNVLVRKYGMMGATISCICIMFSLFISLLTFFIISYKKERK